MKTQLLFSTLSLGRLHLNPQEGVHALKEIFLDQRWPLLKSEVFLYVLISDDILGIHNTR
jgi:hypothetical protein